MLAWMSAQQSSAGINNINTKELSMTIINIPSISEQEEIVRRVDKLFALAEKIEERYTNVKKSLAKAEKAIYVNAFKGEL